MKFVIVHPSLDYLGGAERLVIWLSNGLADRGHDVRLVTAEAGSPTARELAQHVDLVVLRHGRRMHWSEIERAGAELRPLLRGADIVNPHNFPATFWTYIALQGNGIPTIWYCHSIERHIYRRQTDPHYLTLIQMRRREPGSLSLRLARSWERIRPVQRWLRYGSLDARTRRLDPEVARSHARIVGDSNFVADQIRSIFGVEAYGCWTGVPIGDDPGSPPSPGPGEKWKLLTVARLWPEKNVESVLRSVARLDAPWRERVELTVIGGGPDSRYLEALRIELGLQNTVQFTGPLRQPSDVDAYYRQAHAFLHLPVDECFPIVFMEAAARSKPSIGPDHGGPAEFIEPGRTGILVDALDPRAVATALVELLSRPGHLREMGSAARRKVETQHRTEHMVDRFLKHVACI